MNTSQTGVQKRATLGGMTPLIHIWPVIHLDTIELAVANARMAHEEGADGVFLIHMEGEDDLIDVAYWAIRQQVPGLALGANFLSLDALSGMERAVTLGMEASWSDAPGIFSYGTSDQALALARAIPQGHIHFAGVAFKYQAHEPDPGAAAARAWALGLVPTTSGAATGQAPPADKLRAIRRVLCPEAPLACASGITPDNFAQLAPYLSHALVATGISEDFHTLGRDKLRTLMAAR